MSTDYYAACYTCQQRMDSPLASGSIGYGFKVWGDGLAAFGVWLSGPPTGVGAHEGHDVRIVSEHVELPWDEEEDGP